MRNDGHRGVDDYRAPTQASIGMWTAMGRLRPYPAYKESRVGWVGRIPSHWEANRLKYALKVNPTAAAVRNLGASLEVSFIPMEAVGEYGGLDLSSVKPLAEVTSGYTYFGEGDVVVAKITPCFENGKGALAAGLTNGVAFGTTELHVLRVGNAADSRFLFYVSMSDAFRKLGEAEMYGAGGQKRVPESFIENLVHPLPPLSEQHAIASFLDRETAKIDALVAKKERLIELLQEKRAALITQAVTKGLDPDVRMTDSGIEWLGTIPKHWTVKPLRWVVTLQRGHDLPSEQREDGDIPVVSSSGISSTHSKAMACGPGLVTGRYGTIGEFHLIDQPYWPLNTALYSTDLHGNDPRFLFYMLTHLSPIFVLHGNKSAVPGVDRNDVHPEHTAIPHPSEQRAIACFLNNETAKIDGLLTTILKAIDRLKELRTALISAAVTGKIDVRDEADLTPSAVP